MKKAIVFDFDGTLMNTNNLIVNSWQHTFKKILGHEMDLETIYGTFGETLDYSISRLFPDLDLEYVKDIYHSYQYEVADEYLELFDGMDELVQKLYKDGYEIGILTSRNRKSLCMYLENFQLDQYIKYNVTFDDTDIHKPDPRPMYMLLDKMGAKAEDAVMIGDSKYDIGCGNNAGASTILVEWSVANMDEEDEVYKADFIAKSADEIYEIIKSL
ncbi:MAG: HAD-IIIA family hydrolase [Clostridia bacterium]|nr:HAD-IIIA family hydrolase [Clostridia bacterium]